MASKASALLAADSAYHEASRRAMEAWRVAMSLGTIVSWKHGARVLRGEVLHVTGFQFATAGVRVRSYASGKSYNVDAAKIISHMRDEIKSATS